MGKKARDRSGKKARRRAAALATSDDGATDASIGAARPDLPGSAAAGGAPGRRHAVDATELAARLASLSTVLQRQLASSEHGDGLTRARLSALALLVFGGPRTLGALAGAEHVRPPTMTRLVHAMEADGLVAREAHPSDGRSIIIRATPNGERLLERGRARQIAPLARSIADLDRAERSQLAEASDLLGRVLRSATWESAEPSE